MLATPTGFLPLQTPLDSAQRCTFLFRGDELLIREADLALPDEGEVAALGLGEVAIHPVGLLGDRYFRTAWVAPDTQPGRGHVFYGLRRLFGAMDEQLLSIAGRALQIAAWDRTHRFCGACGTPTQLVAGERCLRCPACGHGAYPRISPAMMVLIRRGDAILLAKHAGRIGRFTALAGFLEPGESIEDAIHREVFEEVGLRVRDPCYFSSQSWPFPHSLMIAFTAEYAGGDIALDANEIAEARWFGPDDEIPEIPPGVSIASALIRAHLPKRRAARGG